MKLLVTKELYSLKYTDIPVLGNRFQEGRIEDIRKQCIKQGKVISSTFNTKQTKQQQKTSQHCKKFLTCETFPKEFLCIVCASQSKFPRWANLWTELSVTKKKKKRQENVNENYSLIKILLYGQKHPNSTKLSVKACSGFSKKVCEQEKTTETRGKKRQKAKIKHMEKGKARQMR